MTASERRHRPVSGSTGLRTCQKPCLGWWHRSEKGIERNWLWAPGNHQRSGSGGGQGGCFVSSPPSLEVNVKDWRNKAGIYWEGADLLGTGGQGSTNLLLLLRADLIAGPAAPLPACLSLRVHKTGGGAMAHYTGVFHFLPSPCDLPT